MMEILQFVFSSFWIWLGSTIMLGIVCSAVASAIALIVRGR